MPVQDIQKVLPSLRPPIDDNVAHLTNRRLNREVAYCGYRRSGDHSGCGPYKGGGTCNCGAKVCSACLQVRDSYHRTGGWEGPEWRQ